MDSSDVYNRNNANTVYVVFACIALTSRCYQTVNYNNVKQGQDYDKSCHFNLTMPRWNIHFNIWYAHIHLMPKMTQLYLNISIHKFRTIFFLFVIHVLTLTSSRYMRSIRLEQQYERHVTLV